MKILSGVVILGVGFLLCAGRPARAQYGDMGETLKKGAGEAVKGAAEKAGLAAPDATATPGAAPGATGASAGEPGAAPAAPEEPAAAPGADTGAPEVPSGD